MKYMYVVLIESMSGVGQIARKLMKYDYTHISVCFDEEFQDFCSFTRRKHYSPFDAGFMWETRDCYAFGKHEDVKLKIFKLPVEDEKFERIQSYIRYMEKDDSYLFNVISMVTMPVLHGVKIYKAHNCMSFVAKLIRFTGLVNMDRPYWKYDIPELDELLTPYFFLEQRFERGEIRSHYMDPVEPLDVIRRGFTVTGGLLARLIGVRCREIDHR